MTTKTTTTTATTKPSAMPTTTDNNPFADLTQEQLEKALGVFRSSDSWFQSSSVPYMIALNNKGDDYGFYIFENDFSKVGWYGLEHNGRSANVEFGEGELKPGIVFTAPRMIIIDASPRCVEVTKEGADAYNYAVEAKEAGKEYDPVHLALAPKEGAVVEYFCNFDLTRIDPVTGREYHGADLYYATKDARLTALRTYYLIILLNENNEPLHKYPFHFSVKGTVAVSVGEKLAEFSRKAFAALSTYGDEFKKLAQANMASSSLRKFILELHTEKVRKGTGSKKSDVTSVTDITGKFITDPQLQEVVDSAAIANNGSFWKPITEVHILEGVSFAALPQASSLEGIDVKSEALPF